MIIAFCLQKLNPDDREFIFEFISTVVKQHPENNFLFFTDQCPDTEFLSSSNSQWFVSKKTSGGILNRYLEKKKISGILKKSKADVFVSFDDNFSHILSILHCLVLLRLEKIKSKDLKRATIIIVRTEAEKSKVLRQFNLTKEKVDVCSAFVEKKYTPVNQEEKEKVKLFYSNGKEYFLFSGVKQKHEDVTKVLKAFSLFKKRQQSSMQLLIQSTTAEFYKKDLASYKYRNDVKIISDWQKMELITASAYVVLLPFNKEDSVNLALRAIQCRVPVITFNDPVIKEITGESASYTEIVNPKDLSEQMMRLYTNEGLRMQLSEKAKSIAENFNSEKMAGLIWESITKALK